MVPGLQTLAVPSLTTLGLAIPPGKERGSIEIITREPNVEHWYNGAGGSG